MKTAAPPLDRSPRGFALIVTIVLVAFLVLILVGLATFTRVETQVADNSQQLAKARQNALMALNIAVGQLQKHTGPDQRVTATADIVTPSGHTWEQVTYTATDSIITFPEEEDYEDARTDDDASIESRWQPRHNRHWTGAWANSNTSPYNSNSPITFNPVPGLQSWLVSGNENSATGDAFKPTDLVTGLTVSSSPIDVILDANGKAHRLLVKASAGITTTSPAADLARAVTAPEVSITSDHVPGLPGPQTIGHYAWWVGDEGVKARANLSDPYFSDGTFSSDANKKTGANLTRFQSAQRPAVELVHTDFSPLSPFAQTTSENYATFAATLEKVIAPAQFSYLAPAASDFFTALQKHYHDLTISSRGVLSDTRRGGLKADLSYIFARATLDDFRDALEATHGNNDLAPSSGANGNPLLNAAGTPYATLPTQNPVGGGDYSTANIFRNSATWEQLRSFANQGSSFNSSGEAEPRHHTATQHGLYPLVIQTKLFFRLRIVGGSVGEDGVNRTGTLSIDTIPVVLLANPYAVPLAPADYHLRFNNPTPTPAGPVQLVFGITDATDKPDTDFSTRAYTTDPSYIGNLTFVLRTAGMAAGEAQIFTIDPGVLNADDHFVVTGSNDTRQVLMKNDFDPVPALTFNTDKTISASITITVPDPLPGNPSNTKQVPVTRAALRISGAGSVSQLYLNYTPVNHGLRLLQQVVSQGVTDSSFSGNYVLVVDPMADGIRQGGGIISVLTQPPTTDSPAPRKPSVAGVYFSQQQAPFLQANYRTQRVTYVGNSTYPHPLEWSRRFTKNGSTGSVGDSPNEWIGANLLRPSGSSKTARWGIVNIGEGQYQTLPPASIGGASAGDVGFRNFLYDIPRPGRPLSSLGQLQHFNTAGFIDLAGNGDIHTWQANYPISNSYPQTRVPRDRLFYKFENTSGPGVRASTGYHYDGSYMWNDLLWDRFHFSTYPQTGSFDFKNENLVNSRLRPFRADTPSDHTQSFRGADTGTTDVRLAAQNLLVEGAFNINSTSIGAWKALFASLKKVPVGGESAPNAPFARTLEPLGEADDAEKGTSPNSWNGLRDLDDPQLDALAREMVMQVRKRGPFLSMADFVNRRLSPASVDTLGLTAAETGSDPLGLGLSGALQAALDHTVNLREKLDDKFKTTSSTRVDSQSGTTVAEPSYIQPSALAGFPGHLLQGDLLSALGPALSARSDTFTIRTYGDSVNPATGEVTGRAWCEAVVQRVPDYVRPETLAGGNAAGDISGLHADNQKFGRRYQIVGFRWLGPEDI